MSWQTHPLTPDRFEDFADVINPDRRTNHCWCLSHRLRAKDIEELGTGDRQQAMRRLSELQNLVTYLAGSTSDSCVNQLGGWPGSVHGTRSGSATPSMSRLMTIGSWPLRVSTQCSGSSSRALISWCGTNGGT